MKDELGDFDLIFQLAKQLEDKHDESRDLLKKMQTAMKRIENRLLEEKDSNDHVFKLH